MRILFVVPYAPSLIRVRPYQFIRGLARRGHQLTVAAICGSRQELEELESLRSPAVETVGCLVPQWQSMLNCLKTLPGRDPLQAMHSWSEPMRQTLFHLVNREPFDLVHIEHLRAALFGLQLRKDVHEQSGHGIPIVWDSVDCISHLFRQASTGSRSIKGRLMTTLELARTERFEGRILGCFDRVVVTAPTDAAALNALSATHGQSHNSNVHVVCNGVDLDYFRPSEGARQAATIVITGKMSYHANITAVKYLVKDIMPLVWRQRPEARLVVVGKDPPPDVRALANSPRPASAEGAVEVTGTVADIRPYLHGAAVAVAPVPYGAGVQNKVLEAMACGVAMVASPQAVSALPGAHHNLLVADSAEHFADHLLRVLTDATFRDAIGKAGRSFVEANYSWDRTVQDLEHVYQGVIKQDRVPVHV